MTRSLRRTGVRAAAALAAALGLGAALAPGRAAAEPAPAWPAAPGAVLAFRNVHFESPRTAFDDKGRALMVFNCAPRGRGLFGRFHDLVCDGGSFHVREAGPWVGLQVAKSGAFTLEVTITPAEAPPKTRGVVLAYGDDAGEDVALLHDKTGLALRLAGAPPVELFAPEAGKPVHVLVACDRGTWAAYRDGQPVRSGTLAAAAPAWGRRQVVLGAAWTGADPWRGRIEGIALFPRALAADEAAKETAAIRPLMAGHKPATAVRFRGALVRQAKTADLEAIRPYTRSMTAAEYKVEQVLAGEWKEPTIVVLHWMIIDNKRLPLADRKPGAAVELTVERLDDHPQLGSCRRDDEVEGFADATPFYCESESAP